jgi:hypothetical protein
MSRARAYGQASLIRHRQQGQQQMVACHLEATKRPGIPRHAQAQYLHRLLVNSPDMARTFNGVGGHIRFNSKSICACKLAILASVDGEIEYEFTTT